jgi:hypothetical protein
MKSLFLTSCYGYQWKNIRNWIVSFRNVNPKDDVVIITYTAFDNDTIEKLNNYNIKFLYEDNKNFKRIVVERFRSYANLLSKVKYDFVFLFDLGDIVFQKNPADWVKEKLGNYKIVAGSECIKYENEKWAENDFKQSFGYFFDLIKEKPTYNAGSFAGIQDRIKDLCMNIFSMSYMHQYFAPDQAAFNFLIQTAYKNDTYFASFSDQWCCQCGTTLDPTKMNVEPYSFSKYILESKPIIDNWTVKNSDGKEFFLVHQYNRVPELNYYYNKLYEEK